MYNTLTKAVEAGEVSKELAEALSSSIYEENKTELSSLRDEAKNSRLKVEELSTNIKGISEAKSALETKFATYDEDIKAAQDAGKADTVKILEAERAKHKDLVDNLSTFEKENTKLRLDGAVSSELSKYDVKKEDREMVQFFLRSNTQMNDGSVTFSDGQPLDEAVKVYFGNNASRLNATGSGTGSGSRDGQTGGGQNVRTRDDFEKMNPSQRATFIDKGGKVA